MHKTMAQKDVQMSAMATFNQGDFNRFDDAADSANTEHGHVSRHGLCNSNTNHMTFRIM